MDQRQISVCAVADLAPHPRNARKHSRAQVRAIARSSKLWVNEPTLVDRNSTLSAGQRYVIEPGCCKRSRPKIATEFGPLLPTSAGRASTKSAGIVS